MLQFPGIITGTAHAYMGGNVRFTYDSFENRIGDNVSVSRAWTENYGAFLGSSVLDPRFMRLFAGVNYVVSHPSRAPRSDVKTYNVSAEFFPGRQINWNLYTSKTVVSVPGAGAAAGYDIETSIYGGSMNLQLSRGLGRRNNNRNNFYNNNNWGNNNWGNNNAGRRIKLQLPDITLSAAHMDALSRNAQAPLHETRDNTAVGVFHRPSPFTNLRLEGKAEKYNNLLAGNAYDLTTLDFYSTTELGQRSKLELTGRRADRRFGQVSSNASSYEARLDLRGGDKLSQSYRFLYADYNATGGAGTTSRSGNANLSYAAFSGVSLFGGASYSESETITAATAFAPEQRSEVKSGAVSAGLNANLRKEYRPAPLDPFVLRTSYNFSSGLTSVFTEDPAGSGNGWQYANEAGLGLFSSGWKKESLTADYNYASKRDHSPLKNNALSQTFRLSFSTSRIPKSKMNASVDYSVTESSSAPASSVVNAPADAAAREARSLSYTLGFDHSIASWLKFTARASQQKTSSATNYTLATATSVAPPDVISQQAGATMNADFPLSRLLSLRTSASVDWLRQKPGSSESTDYLQTAGLSWRLRQIDITGDYSRKQTVPEGGLRSEQQRIFLSASRSF